jgi:hypothetical protein
MFKVVDVAGTGLAAKFYLLQSFQIGTMTKGCWPRHADGFGENGGCLKEWSDTDDTVIPLLHGPYRKMFL